jgi:hypothetical protein
MKKSTTTKLVVVAAVIAVFAAIHYSGLGARLRLD